MFARVAACRPSPRSDAAPAHALRESPGSPRGKSAQARMGGGCYDFRGRRRRKASNARGGHMVADKTKRGLDTGTAQQVISTAVGAAEALTLGVVHLAERTIRSEERRVGKGG